MYERGMFFDSRRRAERVPRALHLRDREMFILLILRPDKMSSSAKVLNMVAAAEENVVVVVVFLATTLYIY